jgi:electron transfer flavoprotein alpha subunit
MTNHILVVAEQSDGKFRSITHQILGEAGRLAAQLGGGVEAVVTGSGVAESAAQLGAFGASKVYVADDSSLAPGEPALCAPTVVELIKRTQPSVVFVGATPFGLALAPRLATHLQCALLSDCTGFAMEGGQIKVTRPVYGGRAIGVFEPRKLPLVASLRQNAFAPAVASGGQAAVEALSVIPITLKTKVVDTIKSESGKIELTEAPIVVTGGRGMQGPENFHLVEAIASLLGGAAGATRAVVDAGWRPYGEQVGQTGKTVSPSLYLAVGVSGAMQHLVGMKTSKVIVAINKDPEAPIFKVADYGIVGDALKVLPLLSDEIKKLKSQG